MVSRFLFSSCLSFFVFFSSLLLAYDDKIGRHRIDDIIVLKKNRNKKQLVKSLWKTKLLNGEEIYQFLKLYRENKGGPGYRNGLNFTTLNPYFPRFKEFLSLDQTLEELLYGKPEHEWSVGVNKKIFRKLKEVTHYSQRQVVKWYADLRLQGEASQQVCAFKFSGKMFEKKYHLKTFSSKTQAVNSGYTVTHQYQCGTCSSLRDLALYIAKPDLTSPVRTCVQKATKIGIKKCLMEEVGFSESCSETWAYNGDNTKLLCRNICLRDYGKGSLLRGLANILAGRYEGGNTIKLPNGKEVLRPCLACDEYRSGPAFKYGAGRTRRASGLLSRIKRPENEIFWVNHYRYFKIFRERGEEELRRLRDDFQRVD